MRAHILPNGDLEIRIDEGEQMQLREHRANAADPDSGVNWESDETMRAILEPLITNDEYDWVQPEWIGALTDAPILGIFGDEQEAEDEAPARAVGLWHNREGELATWILPVDKVWWYEPYQVRAPQDDLADTGRCIFQKAPEAKEEA